MTIIYADTGISYQADATYSSPSRIEVMRAAGLRVLRVDSPVIRSRSMIARILIDTYRITREACRVARRESGSVVFISHIEPIVHWPMVILGLLRGKVVCRVTNVFYQPESMTGRPVLSQLRCVCNQRWLRHIVDRITTIFPTRYMPDLMGIPQTSANIRILDDYYFSAIFNGDDLAARTEYFGDTRDRRTFLMFGVVSKAKGANTFIRALELLEIPVNVIFAGRTGHPYEPSWGDMSRISLRHRVVVLDMAVPASVKDSLFRAADCMVVPYEYGYGCSSGNVMDAISYGKPVIASRQYWLEEIVDSAKIGLLFKAGNPESLCDKLRIMVAMEPSELGQITDRCMKIVKENNATTLGLKYRSLFEGI